MSIPLDLPVQVESELVEATQEEERTPNKVIAKALNNYLFVRKFRRVREKMQAEADRSYTPEEIFEMVSLELSLIPLF